MYLIITGWYFFNYFKMGLKGKYYDLHYYKQIPNFAVDRLIRWCDADVAGFQEQPDIMELFLTDFQMRLLWGSRGAEESQALRYAKFDQVLTALSNKLEPASRPRWPQTCFQHLFDRDELIAFPAFLHGTVCWTVSSSPSVWVPMSSKDPWARHWKGKQDVWNREAAATNTPQTGNRHLNQTQFVSESLSSLLRFSLVKKHISKVNVSSYF